MTELYLYVLVGLLVASILLRQKNCRDIWVCTAVWPALLIAAVFYLYTELKENDWRRNFRR